MSMNRRTLLSLGMAAGFASAFSRARADDSPIESISLLSGQTSELANYARPGEYGAPDAAVNVMVDIAGQHRRLFLYVPQKRTGNLVPVVFSHAELSSPKAYDGLLKHWASHGMLVIAPLHDDSIVQTGNQLGDDIHKVVDSVLLNEKVWKSRLNDCERSLDCLPAILQQSSMKTTGRAPIMAGHGLGAFTTQLLSGVRPGGRAWTSDTPLGADAFSAFLEMSPFGSGQAGLTPESFASVGQPVLVATGDADKDQFGETGKEKMTAFSNLPAGYKHLLDLRTMNDGVFYGRNLNDLPTLYMRSVTTIFLLAYGMQAVSTLRLLSGTTLSDEAQGEISLAYR